MVLKKMSLAKSAPDGLKPQECDRSSGRSKLPISYIPEKDAIQDTTHDCTLQVKVLDKMHFTITVFHQGTSELFLGHVQMTLKTISPQELDVAYQMACKEDSGTGKSLLQPLWPKGAYKEGMKICYHKNQFK